MENDIRITALIPNYNHAKYLEEAILSACEQDYPPHQVLVLDDCSTDNSVQIAESLAARYPMIDIIRYPQKSANWLEAYFRNMVHIKGNFVSTMAADDRLYPGFFREAAALLRQHPTAGVLFSHYNYFDDTGRIHTEIKFGFESARFLEKEELREQLRRPFVYEVGMGSIARTDALIWLGNLNIHEVGPYVDLLGMPLIAAKYGACYLPYLGAGYRFSLSGGTFQQHFYRDARRTYNAFEQLVRIITLPEVQSFLDTPTTQAVSQKAIGVLPGDIRQKVVYTYRLKQGDGLLRQGRHRAALDFFTAMKNEFPNVVDLHERVGFCQLQLGDIPAAEAEFCRAIAIMPRLARLRVSLGAILHAQNRTDEAITQYTAAIEFEPSSVEAYRQLAILYAATGRPVEAAQAKATLQTLEAAAKTGGHVQP